MSATATQTTDAFPSFADLGRAINEWATTQEGEWCGVPMPLPHAPLVVEDRNPWRDRLVAASLAIAEPAKPGADLDTDAAPLEGRIINHWYSAQHRATVYVVETPDGKRRAGLGEHDNNRKCQITIKTAMCAMNAWLLDTEMTAIDTLSGLLQERPHLFEVYLTTGQFLETSARSGITYLFRRGKPTLAISSRGKGLRILCALCLHPIGYYDGTWAGSMTPTDDVIAHLMLMRADEALYWRRANQHPSHVVEAGL